MRKLAKDKEQPIAEQALYWLSFRQSNDWFSLLDWSKTGIDTERARQVAAMKVRMSKVLDEQLSADERRWNIEAMTKDPVGGQMLLGLMAEGRFPDSFEPVVARLIFDNPDKAVRVQASLYFKRVSGETYSIGAILKMEPNKTTGAAVFDKNCSSCHQVKNSGVDIGPELTMINKKFDRESLLDAIINPSGGVVFGYEAWTINTKEGESFFGFLVADGEKTIVIKDLTGVRHTITTDRITSRKKQEKSLMPEPSALAMSEQDLADLSEYLMTLH
jgi:putative heme-binding domain-containing protein